jgi:23S rRNA (cytidine1920-2'-O)/16S rRNA (cytidine1409-2'-O)-methyltransferase
VKPQFEVGRGRVGRGGIVSDPAVHRETLETVARGALAAGYSLRGACASPITGAEGNREFFLHLGREAGALGAHAFDAMMARVFEPS